MPQAVIVAASRSAIGTFNGSLAALPAVAIGSQVIGGVLAKFGIDKTLINEVIVGQVLTADCGQNPARQAAINAGLPNTVPALTINMVCGLGHKAVQLGAQSILAGDAALLSAGGMESMSQSAHLLPHSRSGQKMSHWETMATMFSDGLWDVFHNIDMGITTANLATRYKLTREQQNGLLEFPTASRCRWP